MSSLIEGYNYDIFISYRQKDNKGDQWVSEFVEALKTELESTFKEDISVYFDINPHDGLLATHDVDESLKDKLKCLIFIPIISRTYCDPKSFAWEHEFKAFIEQASNDKFGLKIKLSGSNVASRVLPIVIYDLEPDDINLYESVAGGVIRGIDFIYAESGVNRPLKPEDDEKVNLNKTKYRNQINKTGNAIKEIISAIKQPVKRTEETFRESANRESASQGPVAPKNGKKTVIAGSIAALALVILGILFIPKLFSHEDEPEKSIAVIPFVYLSDEPDKQYLADGVMDAILLHLAKIQDLRVLPRTSVEQFRETTKTISQISKELDVTYVLEGSFTKYEDDVKLIVQLITTKAGKEEHVWANEYNNKWEEIFSVQSEVAQTIARELNAAITPEEKQLIDKVPTNDLTAYDLTLQAQKIFYDFNASYDTIDVEFGKVRQLCKAALELDPGYALAYYWLGKSSLSDQFLSGFGLPFYLDTALYFFNRAIVLDSTLPEAYEGRGSYYVHKAETQKAIDDFNESIRLSPNNPLAYLRLGSTYLMSRDYVDALKNINKADKLTKSDETQISIFTLRYWIYLSVGDYQKILALEPDSEGEQLDTPSALQGICWALQTQGKYEEMLTMTERIVTVIPEYAPGYVWKAKALLGLGRIQEAEDCIRISLKYAEPEWNAAFYVGIVLWKNGKRDEAMKYFNMQIDNCIESINLKDEYGQLTARRDLAGVYAFLGNKEEAYKWLREYEKLGFFGGGHEHIKVDLMFDNLRNDDEFRAIVKRANDKAAEDRVRINELEEKGEL